MENFPVTKIESGFHIDGFPDAIKVVQITSPRAKRLAGLALHKVDLEFAAECLSAINAVPSEQWVVRQAIWRSAVMHVAKCFGDSKARFALDKGKVLKGDPDGVECFGYFESLRNKHLAHDENSLAQALPGAVLNNGQKPYKIEKIVCLAAIADTLDQGNWSNLDLLVQKSLAWIEAEFVALCEQLTKELEAEPYADLLARPSLEYSKPQVDEIHLTRNQAAG